MFGLFRQTQRQISCLREMNQRPLTPKAFGVEKTVAVYRQTPNADVEAHREPFAASAEQSMSALITISIPAAR